MDSKNNVSIMLAPTYDLAKEFTEKNDVQVTIEAEYGEKCIEGTELTLAHHGPRSNNQAPCYASIETPVNPDKILISHMDLDTVGGIMLVLGEKPENEKFWTAAEYIDVNGPHHVHEFSQETQDLLNAVWAEEFKINQAEGRFPRDVISDATDNYNKRAESIKAVLDPERNKELIENGREWEQEATKATEDKLLYETKDYRVFSTDGVFCSAAYYSPADDEVKKATIVFNQKFSSITLAFEDGGKTANAAKILQGIFGPEAGGREGIAGSPRGKVMTEEDLKKVVDVIDKMYKDMSQQKTTPDEIVDAIKASREKAKDINDIIKTASENRPKNDKSDKATGKDEKSTDEIE